MTRSRGHLRLVPDTADPDRPPSRRRPRRPDTVTFQVRMVLDDTNPPLWRRLELASNLFLNDLHEIIQVAVGWTDSHLHRFASGPAYFGRDTEYYLCPFEMQEEPDGVPEEQVRLDEVLTEPGDTLYYRYDFGDDWLHILELEAVAPRADSAATCSGGERPGPAEDCGGVPGYEMFDAANDTSNPDRERAVAELREMYGFDVDPATHRPVPFDVDEVNRALGDVRAEALPTIDDMPAPIAEFYHALGSTPMRRRLRQLVGDARPDAPVMIDVETAGAMVRPYRWLLDRIGDDGIKLTNAGYLPPAHVEAAMAELGMEDEWIGKFNREDQTLPVLLLRESAQKLGLLRKYRGTLQATSRARKLRNDPVALWWHLAANLPLKSRDEFVTQAGLLYLATVAAGAGGGDGAGDTGAGGLDVTGDTAGEAGGGYGGRESGSREAVVAALLTDAGWRIDNGAPVDRRAVVQATSDTEYVLRRLGALEKSGLTGLHPAKTTPQGVTFARASLRS